METIQINLKSPIYGTKVLNIMDIKECGNELLIRLNDEECYNIYVGDKLIFTRFIYENGTDNFTLTEYVDVLREDENHVIHTTIPLKERRNLVGGYAKYVSGYTENEETYEYYIIKCAENHNIFPQDVGNQEIYIKDYDGNVYTYNNISIPLKRSDRAAEIEDCLSYLETIEGCDKKIDLYRYDFLPEKISRKSIIISGFNPEIKDKMVYLETKFNPFYFYNENEESVVDEYGNVIKTCILYGDGWREGIDANNDKRKIVNYGNTRTQIGLNAAYWNVSLGLGGPSNETILGSDDTFNTNYVKNLEESLVPDIIDMERVKYSPMVYEDGELTIATGITFNFHFRKRKEIDNDRRNENTLLTSGNVYCDGWYIAAESADTAWWNGMEYYGSNFSNESFNNFLTNKGEVSDLLGYLNFTDNDVYFRKKKLSQSFIRLTFYDSWKPIEQKLLYHSTVFLDATTLYGKYVKQLLHIEDNGVDTNEMNQNAIVVFYSGNTDSRIDTQITITNEYDRTKSSEGFNLYLFAEDAVLNSFENIEKTIYMKVEFNHAGNGKTTPMIKWPKSGNTYLPLTIDNFIENLYIPIKIKYFNGKYIYYIPDAYKNEDGNISLVLFEPKLDFIEDKDLKNTNGEN